MEWHIRETKRTSKRQPMMNKKEKNKTEEQLNGTLIHRYGKFAKQSSMDAMIFRSFERVKLVPKKQIILHSCSFFFYYSKVFICHFVSCRLQKFTFGLLEPDVCCHRENGEVARKCMHIHLVYLSSSPFIGPIAYDASKRLLGSVFKQSHEMSHSIRIHNEMRCICILFSICFNRLFCVRLLER